MKLARHIRRLRARWRLHRMEWAAMHRPLEPPRGYEKYHTMEAVFPGYREQRKKIETWAEFRATLAQAWRLYLHYYFPDPEIEKVEQRIEAIKQKKRERKLRKFLVKGEQVASQSVDTAKQAAETAVKEAKRNRPAMEEMVRDRLAVLRDAFQEFTEGYQEASSGRTNFWGEVTYSDDIVKEDNRPVRYQVVEEGEEKTCT